MIAFAVCGVVLLFFLSIAFQIAGKLRLVPALVYALTIGIIAPGWATRNEFLANAIFIGLVGLAVLSWVLPAVRKFREWRYMKTREKWTAEAVVWALQNGKQNVRVDEDGNIQYD